MESYLDNFQCMNKDELLLINGGAGWATVVELTIYSVAMAASIVSIPITGWGGVAGAAGFFSAFSSASEKL